MLVIIVKALIWSRVMVSWSLCELWKLTSFSSVVTVCQSVYLCRSEYCISDSRIGPVWKGYMNDAFQHWFFISLRPWCCQQCSVCNGDSSLLCSVLLCLSYYKYVLKVCHEILKVSENLTTTGKTNGKKKEIRNGERDNSSD